MALYKFRIIIIIISITHGAPRAQAFVKVGARALPCPMESVPLHIFVSPVPIFQFENLDRMGFSKDVLKLLAFCTDGAHQRHCQRPNVFAKRIERDDVIMFHCIDHRLELAVQKAVSSTNTVTHMRLDTLFVLGLLTSRQKNCTTLPQIP